MARAALAARAGLSEADADADFCHAKIKTAAYYATHVLSGSGALRHAITEGSNHSVALAVEHF